METLLFEKLKNIDHSSGLPEIYEIVGRDGVTMAGDIWFNFSLGIWEVVPIECLCWSTKNYLVARPRVLIQESELPEELKERKK